MPDLDRANDGIDAKIARYAHGPVVLVDDREEERVALSGRFLRPSTVFADFREGSVRQVGPVESTLVELVGGEQPFDVTIRVKVLEPAIATGEGITRWERPSPPIGKRRADGPSLGRSRLAHLPSLADGRATMQPPYTAPD